ncbi:MAG: thermostable hemolysin [Burkholderiales bacterium]
MDDALFPVRHAHRTEAAQFIRDTFRDSYGARLGRLMPLLLARQDRQGNIIGACGLRRASRQRLFLECYLDAPVQQLLMTRSGEYAVRAGIVEVGNLALRAPYSARALIADLTRYLACTGCEWAVFTAVPSLRNAFRRLDIPCFHLGEASLAHLPPAARTDWGNYYDCGPQVLAVRVSAAMSALRAVRAAA